MLYITAWWGGGYTVKPSIWKAEANRVYISGSRIARDTEKPCLEKETTKNSV